MPTSARLVEFAPQIAHIHLQRVGVQRGGGLAGFGRAGAPGGQHVIAGDDFAAPRHIRMSYATSRDNLAHGFDAIERALATLG